VALRELLLILFNPFDLPVLVSQGGADLREFFLLLDPLAMIRFSLIGAQIQGFPLALISDLSVKNPLRARFWLFGSAVSHELSSSGTCPLE